LVHADELFALIAVPPTAAFDNLPYTGVVVSVSNEEFKIIAIRIRSGAIVF
jgi:hypothetical protein